MRVPQPVDEGAGGFAIRKIGTGRNEDPTRISDFLLGLVHRRAAHADHRAAGPGDRNRDTLSDTGIGSGDDDAPAGEAEARRQAHRSVSIATISTSV